MRVFTELTPECDYTTQLFAMGYEQKEIAEIKCRSIATINNQIAKGKEVLNYKNGRELALRYAEKLTGKSIFSITEKAKRAISVFLLTIFFLGSFDTHQEFRRIRRTRVRTERIIRREI